MHDVLVLFICSFLYFVSFFQALLTKHVAIMSDLRAYGTEIDGLREQSQNCKVSTLVRFSVGLQFQLTFLRHRLALFMLFKDAHDIFQMEKSCFSFNVLVL